MLALCVFVLGGYAIRAADDLPKLPEMPFEEPAKPTPAKEEPKKPSPAKPARKPEREPKPAVVEQPEPQEPGAKLAPRVQREVNRLVTHFRRARKDLQKQAEVVSEATQAGPAAVSALLQAIGQDLYPQLTRYRSKFYQQAAAVAKRQLSQVNLDEIAQLRFQVLSLAKEPNLTHDMIVQRGDPAIKRLEEIFVLRPADVLAQSKDLPADRAKLHLLGQLWEQCAVYLYQTLPAGPDKPKDPPTFERYLQGEEEMAVGLSMPMSPSTREILAANTRLAASLDPEESRAILALNLMRNLLGLTPVAIDPKLCAAARDHSKDMESLKFFSHESPVPGKKSPWDRAKRAGTNASAENIFMGLHDGRAANLGWFHSPGHHKNMLGNHKRVGMGRYGAYFTEMFGD